LIPGDAWQSFIEGGRLTRQRILEFAASINRHPAIVIGRLKHERLLSWRVMTDLQPPVREHLSKHIDD
jgi:HTH-type transcriptional regulator/antitoxin HigA